MLRRFVICFLFMGFVSVVCAQDLWDLARTTVNGKRVAIEYGRPKLSGRTLASLMMQLPPDRIWRAGAGPVTILTTETDLLIGGKKLRRSYSLYMHCPEKGDYSLVINKDLDNLTGTVLRKAGIRQVQPSVSAFHGLHLGNWRQRSCAYSAEANNTFEEDGNPDLQLRAFRQRGPPDDLVGRSGLDNGVSAGPVESGNGRFYSISR